MNFLEKNLCAEYTCGMLFNNRTEAGKLLAEGLAAYRGQPDIIAMGLARGGVVCAAQVAKDLGAALDVLVVRKVGAPDNGELALGAVCDRGEVWNHELIALLGVSKEYLRKEVEKEREIVKQRKALYFGKRAVPSVKGKVVLLIDDGIATGASMKMAIEAVREQGPERLVLAIPVASPEALAGIRERVDEVVCLSTPENFGAVGTHYRDFSPVTDQDVIAVIQSQTFS